MNLQVTGQVSKCHEELSSSVSCAHVVWGINQRRPSLKHGVMGVTRGKLTKPTGP